MIIRQLREVIFRMYQEGRVSSAAITFNEEDIMQMAKMAYGNMLRLLYYESLKTGEGSDYSSYSGLLSIKEFALSEDIGRTGRRIDMIGVDLYRLPKNAHLVNFYPIGCSGKEGDFEITQVAPGEENFYLNDPEMEFFKFCVVKGQGLNFYNIPGCVKKIGVEGTFDDPYIDIPLDICFNISNQVLGEMLRIPGFLGKSTDNSFQTPQMIQMKNRLQAQQDQQLI